MVCRLEARPCCITLAHGISKTIKLVKATYIRFEGTLIVCGQGKVSPLLWHFEPVKIGVEVPRLSNTVP